MPIRLLDTNIVSYLVRRHSLADEYLPFFRGFDLAVCFMSVAELHEWGLFSNWGTAWWGRLRATLADYVVIESGPAVNRTWAEVRLARRSQPISVSDAWIAAAALVHGFELVIHNSRDFRGIRGLQTVSIE